MITLLLSAVLSLASVRILSSSYGKFTNIQKANPILNKPAPHHNCGFKPSYMNGSPPMIDEPTDMNNAPPVHAEDIFFAHPFIGYVAPAPTEDAFSAQSFDGNMPTDNTNWVPTPLKKSSLLNPLKAMPPMI